MRVIIGEGNIGGNNVMIENPLIKYTRTANETQNFNDEFTISVYDKKTGSVLAI